MSEQTSFLESGAYNTLQVKLNSRTDDPAPSKRAAAKLESVAIRKSLDFFLATLQAHGPCTVREAAKHTLNETYWVYEWNRRVKQWHVAGHIEIHAEVQQGRVWKVKE